MKNKLSLLLLVLCAFVCMNVEAQSTYDAMAPFGFATCTSRTDAGSASNITGGGCYVYPVPSSVASSKNVVTLTSTGSAMDTQIKSAITNNDIIIFDGSQGDFILEAYVEMKNLSNKTLLGINNARLCTKWFATDDDVAALEAAGVSGMNTSSGGGTLSNGTSVTEQAEFNTRKIMIERYNDDSEWWRKSGIFYIKGCTNIIIRNLKFQGPGAMDLGGADLVSVIDNCKNIWVDHCEFYDGQDGNFDITNYSDKVTVSWCTFSYTGRSYMHQNTNLCGSSDDKTGDDDKLSITWAYNMWGQGCAARMPMARFGRFHMLNNYYNCAGNKTSCMNPRKNSEFLIEGNYFESDIQKIYEESKDDGKGNLPPTKVIWRSNNVYGSRVSSTLPTADDATAATSLIPYAYGLISPTSPNVKDVVSFQAGARLVVDGYGNFIVPTVSQSTPVITENLASSSTAYVGSEKTLSISASYAESYQWYRNTIATNSGGTVISGATSSTYRFTPSSTGTYYYYCVATNSQATGTKSVASAVCTLTVSNAPTMWTATSATYNSTSKGYEVAGVGTFYKSTSGGTTTVNTDNSADWIAGKGNIKTGSSLFIFSPAMAVTRLKLYVKDSSTRTLSSTACSSTLNGTYSTQSSTADKSVSSYTEVTITFNSAVAANQFIQITFNGNVNVYGIEPITSSTPTPTLYTVTYNANGHGTCSTPSWTQTSEGQSTTLPSATASTGYTFLGWATSSTATSAQYNAGANYTPGANVTLYAVYQQEQQGGGNEGTVEYTKSSNGSTSSSANIGTSYTIPGTYVAGKGNGSYTIGEISDNGVKMRTGSASFSNTLTSLDGKKKFEIDVNNGYTITAITFKAANNYGNTSTISEIYVDGDYSNNLLASSVTLNSDKATAEGGISGFTAHEKIEFAVETTVVGSEAGTQINFFAAVTYKANTPTPQTYTVSYNLNDHGDAIADVVGVTALPSTLPTPTATGYTFDGWYTDSGLTSAAVAGAPISANTTLYAKWTISSSSELLSKTWAQVCDGRMGDSWYGSDEAQSVADIVLAVQKNNGGWMKNDQLHKLTTTEYNTLVTKKGEHSCFDNYATTQEMRFLLKVYKATNETKYLDAFKRALDLIITAGQGKQGGWGQYWPNSGDDSYQDYITFNDDLMTNVMKMLQNVYEAKGEYADIVDDATKASCKTAWDAAIQCVLNCQIDDNGTKAIWCAQHDPADFLPAEGRPHEMPSAGPYESSNLLSYLMSIKNPSEQLKTSIRAAVEWMKNHKSFENKVVEDCTNSSGAADRHIIDKQGSNLWGRFIQIGDESGTTIYNKLWNKLKTRGKKRAHHTTGTEYYEYQLLDASYDASKAYRPIYAIYTNDYPELFYRHLYNYEDTPDAMDKYGALVATSLKAANRRSYQYLGSWPDAIINSEYPAWEQRLEAADFGGDLTDVEISTATYSSSAGATWNFSDGFVVTNASNKGYAAGVGTTVKFSAANYTVTIPEGYKVKKVLFYGYSNATSNAYISNLNGTNYSNSQYVFPAKDSNETTTYKTQQFDLSSTPVKGTLTFGIGGAQTCLVITLYCEIAGDDNPIVPENITDESVVTFVPGDFTSKTGSATKEKVTLQLNVDSYNDNSRKDASENSIYTMKCKSTGQTMTFSSENKITSIILYCTSDNFSKVKITTPAVGSIVKNGTDYTYTWSGSAENIVLTFERADGQSSDQSVYVKSVKVTSEIPVALFDATDAGYTSFTEGTYTVKLKKTFPAGKWTSLVLPFSASTAQLMAAFPNNAANTEVAVIKEMKNNMVYFTTQAHIDANVPVLIKVDDPYADNTYTFNDVTVENSDAPNTKEKDGIMMKGIYKKTEYNDGQVYTDRQHLYFVAQSKFYDWSYLSYMPPFSAYIYTEQTNNEANAKPLIFMLDGEATGIYSVNSDKKDDGPEYNAVGQRISKDAKGLHIKNGKKYFVK